MDISAPKGFSTSKAILLYCIADIIILVSTTPLFAEVAEVEEDDYAIETRQSQYVRVASR